MLKTQYSRVINKRTSIAGEVPTIGPSEDHTDGSWSDTDIYPGEFYINMEDQKVWFGWVTGSTSGVTQIYPPPGPGGGITIVGGTGIQVSGASPDFAVSLSTGDLTFDGLVTGSQIVEIGASSQEFIPIITDTTTQQAIWIRFNAAAYDATTPEAAIFEGLCGWFNDGTGWASIAGSACNYYEQNGIDNNIDLTFDTNIGGEFGILIDTPAGINNLKFRVFWEYTIVQA